jgi:DNA-binding MarR family transcriptional regulator
MWGELLIDSGLNEREVRSIMVLGANPKMKASELAKELDTTRLDAYNSLSRNGNCHSYCRQTDALL